MFTFLSMLVYSCQFELNENKEIYFIKLNGLLRDFTQIHILYVQVYISEYEF